MKGRGLGKWNACFNHPSSSAHPVLSCYSLMSLFALQMLSFMHAQYTFFQQGYSLLHELDPYMKKLATEVSSKNCRKLTGRQ